MGIIKDKLDILIFGFSRESGCVVTVPLTQRALL